MKLRSLLAVAVLTSSAPAGAMVSCLSTYCLGPAQEVVRNLRIEASTIQFTLHGNSVVLNCGPAGPKKLSMSIAGSGSTLATVLSALAMNRVLRFSPQTGSTASCPLASVELGQ